MANYIVSGNSIRVLPDDAVGIVRKLPLGIYKVCPIPMSSELELENTVSFVMPEKIYGETIMQADRIIDTFEARDRNTGVLLSGEKGAGKTFLAKLISVKMFEKGYSTLLINQQFNSTSISNLLQNITEPCLVIFDEFEKIFSKQTEDEVQDPQNGLLTLLDGLVVTKKLFVFTCNESQFISPMMKNRPGRIYYRIDFGGLSDEVIQEFCKGNLKEKKHLKEIMTMKKMFSNFTFDMLQALVEEVNRYNENPLDAVKMMNIVPESFKESYTIKIEDMNGNVYCSNYDDDDVWVNPYADKILNIGIWREKNNRRVNEDTICFRRKDLVEQDGDMFKYILKNKYVIILKKCKEISSKDAWKLAYPY